MVNFQRIEPDKLRGADGGKHLIGVAINPYIAQDSEDPAISADQNRCAKNAMEGLTIHGFFAPDAVGLQHLVLLIRNKRDGEPMLVSKGFLCLWRVGRNTQYRSLVFRKRTRPSPELHGLLGAARRARARIDIQHALFSPLMGQR